VPDCAPCIGEYFARQWSMRRRLLVTLIVLVVVAAGVFLSVRANGPRYSTSVRGELLISGGVPPGTRRPTEGQVTAVSASGRSFDVSVTANGKFTLRLPPGQYKLSGHSPQFGGGKYECLAPRAVTVALNRPVRTDVVCIEI
jgi:hypothetical protein